MKLKLYSKLFRDFFDEEIIEFTDTSISDLYFIEDKNVHKISGRGEERKIFDDFCNISLNSQDLKNFIFNSIPEKLIEKILSQRAPSESLNLFFTDLSMSAFSDIDLSQLKNLSLFKIRFNGNVNDGFSAITQMQNLEELHIANCENFPLNSSFKNIPNPKKLKRLHLCGDLPIVDQLSEFVNLEELNISGIKNAELLKEFLKKLPVGNIKKLNIVDCNMNRIDQEVIERFESITDITLIHNIDANYNEIMDNIPNPENVASIAFRTENPNKMYWIFEKLLSKYNNLQSLELGSLNIELKKLHEYLLKADKLENITLQDIDFQDLDFLDGINPNLAICIRSQKDLNFSLITPDIAKEHLQIYYADSKNKIVTYSQEDGGYSLITVLDASELYFTQELIKNAGVILDAKLDILHDSNGINQTLAFLTPYSEKCKNGYMIILEDYTKGTPQNIDRLNQHNTLREVVVSDAHNDDRNYIKRFSYDVDKYKELQKEVKKITADIPAGIPELDKFMIIYRRLGAKIIYDNGIVDENKYSQYAKDNVDDSRNCVNGLLRDTCVCAGYADILYNCLREVGINAYKISGIAGEYHQWNVVQIDGKLYNVDLTWDVPSIVKNKVTDLPYCLIGDEEFRKNHKPTHGFNGQCHSTYDRWKMKMALKRAMDFDNIPYKKNIFDNIIDNFKNLFNKNTALPEPENARMPTPKRPSWELSEENQLEVKEKLEQMSNDIYVGIDNTTRQEQSNNGRGL